MEICGGQTHAIVKYGIDELLPKEIALIHGLSGSPLEAYSKQTHTGFEMGLEYATNGTMTIKGRKIELVMRDTQSEPTKAVNAAVELTRRHKVTVMWGPLNSGETAAAIANIARDGVPQLHPCWVDTL
ncbi:MAG: ABC transporter substrate-binding protein, partial [Pseudanabaena sp. CRU_2_10]|nr:ABC transporter substrate-binding protein [Pseudanabaena sp. CRU_2_10]